MNTTFHPGSPEERMPFLSSSDLSLIHNASVEILETTGVNFNDASVTELFHQNGFKTRENVIFFSESQVEKALSTTIPDFTIYARNPEYNVHVRGNMPVLMPTGGVPNVAQMDGTQRRGTLADFQKACKLIQTSDLLDMGGYLMVHPGDVDAETAHLDMMFNYMTLCDKPMLGATGSGPMARDTLEMAGILFGGKEKLKTIPVMASIVNVLSPLRYSREQTQALVEMAAYNQPIVITNMILAGGTGPVSLASLLALANAEILAGVVLTQLVSPGAPVIYGTTSAPLDMKTMVGAVGAVETVKIASAAIQLAHFYNLPCRTGGGLTDAHIPDAQAMAESVLMLNTVMRNGADFIYHACGQIGSYIAVSFEKWIIDEQVCTTLKQLMQPLDVSDTALDLETITEIGIGGQYLCHPKTFEQFRILSQTSLFNRKDYSKWHAQGALSAAQATSKILKQRLDQYEKPDIDPAIEKALSDYVTEQKEQQNYRLKKNQVIL